jgi:hypothetical protein
MPQTKETKVKIDRVSQVTQPLPYVAGVPGTGMKYTRRECHPSTWQPAWANTVGGMGEREETGRRAVFPPKIFLLAAPYIKSTKGRRQIILMKLISQT